MRTRRLSLMLLASWWLGACAVAAEENALRWRSDWEEARKEARSSGKPLFVVFRCPH